MKTFKCEFGGGVSCEMSVPDKLPPGPPTTNVLNVIWEGRPSPALLPAYKAWMHSVNQILANEWNKTLMHAFLVSPTRYEAWVYEPGKPPERVLSKHMARK